MEKQSEIEKKQNSLDVEPEDELQELHETPVVQLIPEDSKVREKQIKELRQQIKDGVEKQKQIEATRAYYGNLPDEALIESDKKILDDLPHQQARLAVLEEKEKEEKSTSSKKSFLKKIAAFISF